MSSDGPDDATNAGFDQDYERMEALWAGDKRSVVRIRFAQV